jgi:hypothetical protein
MDELIYILIIVFWIVLTLIGRQNKRKKKSASAPEKASVRPGGLEELIGILAGQPVVSVQPEAMFIPEVVPEPVRKPITPVRNPETSLKSELSDFMRSPVLTYDSLTHFEIKEPDHGAEPDHLFDLRRAIIYSEILKRPYI